MIKQSKRFICLVLLSLMVNVHAVGEELPFTGPLVISNGVVNVSVPVIDGNAVTLVGGALNLNAGAAAYFSSLMVRGGVFQVASNAVLALKGIAPWVRVRGAGTVRLLDGSKLLRLEVSGTGRIDLNAGGTATVYRAWIGGIELPYGFYSKANCAAITGSGLLHVRFRRDQRSIVDTFARVDAPMVYDSLGQTEEPGGSCWSEFRHHIGVADCASLNNGELRLGIGNSEPGLALTAASWPDNMCSTRMRFERVGAAGATVKNGCGLIMRRNITIRTGDTSAESADWAGTVYVLITPTGSLAVRENYRDDKYFKNPFTGSTNYAAYGPPGSLPTSINGLPFDANGDGRLGDDEPFDLSAILSGNRLQVLINGAPIMACNDFSMSSASEENCAGFWKNRLGSKYYETHDSYHDDFCVTNLPYLIRHSGSFDPDIAATMPRENWTFTGDTNAVPVGPINETIGGETVSAWRINDISTGKLAYYKTDLSASEIANINTNRWLLKARLRVVNSSDTIDTSVFAQISTDSYTYSMNFGSDASGNAQIRINDGDIHTVLGGSVYHTYELEYDPVSATASLLCDGTPLQVGIVKGGNGYKRVLWGANSSAGTGCAHYAEVQFGTLRPEPPPLPTPPLPPSSATVVVLGCSNTTEWSVKRAAALNRPREVIYNNDGNEPYLWPTNQSFSIAGFLDMRTTPVLGSQVDTVFYCPISSGFGFLSADIPSADLMLRDLGTVKHMRGKRNVLQDFLDMGTDPVREVVSWCRMNNLEVFVTLRVNDTHDQGTDQTQVGPPYAYPGNALFSPFKIQHPEFLMGSYTNRPPHCNWSAVDFTHDAVRERQFQMCRDICTHYDLDGLDLDFFRHMQLFKSVAMGGTASDAERDMMTDLMRRIRAAAETAGRRRRRPILLSIRVPDSVPYCRDVGIDLEKWLSEGLVDMVMTSGYWRHNPWEYTVDLCQRYNIKCYASLDESRLSAAALAPSLKRQNVTTYRARAMAARRAGMDGVMYFNLFTPAAIRAFMRGNLANMRLDDKRYFVSYRGKQSGARRYVRGAAQHFSLSELSVSAIAQIAPGNSRAFSIWIGDDVEALIQADIRPDCELRLDVAVPAGTTLLVKVNGRAVTGAMVEDRIQRYALQLEDLICGENLLEFSVSGGAAAQTVTLKDAAIFLTGFVKGD